MTYFVNICSYFTQIKKTIYMYIIHWWETVVRGWYWWAELSEAQCVNSGALVVFVFHLSVIHLQCHWVKLQNLHFVAHLWMMFQSQISNLLGSYRTDWGEAMGPEGFLGCCLKTFEVFGIFSNFKVFSLRRLVLIFLSLVLYPVEPNMFLTPRFFFSHFELLQPTLMHAVNIFIW